jgi:hypothetical protein
MIFFVLISGVTVDLRHHRLISGITVDPQMGNGASLVPERCQNSAEPLERNKRLAERN